MEQLFETYKFFVNKVSTSVVVLLTVGLITAIIWTVWTIFNKIRKGK